MLDRKITEEYWRERNSKWLLEKETLAIKLLASQKADTNYLESAQFVLELAHKAAGLFKRQSADQKRKLVVLVTSNCSFDNGKLDLELKPIFKSIMEIGETGKWLPE